jgi:hypothetical protein
VALADALLELGEHLKAAWRDAALQCAADARRSSAAAPRLGGGAAAAPPPGPQRRPGAPVDVGAATAAFARRDAAAA